MSSTDRSLVIGAHTRLPAQFIEPFARSLRATGFKGTFAVLAGRCGDEDMTGLRGLADVVVDLDAEYVRPGPMTLRLLGFLRSTRGFRRTYPTAFQVLARSASERASFQRWSRLEYHLEGLQALRYVHYRRYLSALDPEPDVVMLTDLRDVIFQRDPFDDPVSGLEVYLEDESVRIGHEIFNTRWIRDLYGNAGLEELKDRRVSCSGTVIGTRDAVVRYLSEMISEIVWRRRPLGSHDQGIHNMLVHRERLPFAAVIQNGHGRVLTMGKMNSYATDGGVVRNLDGTVPAVLHQWDRHQQLAAEIDGRDR